MKFIAPVISLLFISAFVISGASASCMTEVEKNDLFNVTEALNLSVEKTMVFYELFESFCERYERTENVTNETMQYVESYMLNYTSDFEERANLAEALFAISNLIDASSNITNIDQKIDTKIYEYSQSIDIQLNDMRDTVRGVVTVQDFESFKSQVNGNISATIKNLENEKSAEPFNPIAYWWVVIIAAIAIWWYKFQYLPSKNREIQLQSVQHIPREENMSLLEKKMLEGQLKKDAKFERTKRKIMKNNKKKVLDTIKEIENINKEKKAGIKG